VATVVSNKIHAVAGGTATFAAVSSYDATKMVLFTVTVTIGVASITAANATMKVGEADKDPVITWNPANATNKGYSMSSSNTAVATIAANKLHAVAAGTSNVIVTATDGGKVDTLLLTVTQPVYGLTVADMTIKRPEGDKDPVIVWNPVNASNKGFTLTGGTAGVATVAGTKINPVGYGTASFVITAADGGKTDTFNVSVLVPVESITANDVDMNWFDADVTPNVTIKPADAPNRNYSMQSSDTNVATIVNGKIHAVAWGTANVTITSTDNASVFTVIQVRVSSFTGGGGGF
jgi:hypothetical protein